MAFKYQPEWEGPLSGRSFEKQTEDFLNGIESRVDEIDTRQTPSDAIPNAPGVGSAGTSDEYSRGDHQHPSQTTISGNAGTATKLETVRNITLSGDVSGSAVFDGSADCSIDVTIPGKMLNVKDFGATGDGVTDDSASLRSALESGAGRTVYVPAGTYLCSTHSLCIYSNTTLIADKGTIIRRGYTTATEGTRVLLYAAPLIGETTIHDVEIKNIVFDGNGVNYGTASFDLVAFLNAPFKNLIIEECSFLDVVNYHAIDLAQCSNVLIRRCRFLGWNMDSNATGYDSMCYQREAIQFDIGSNQLDDTRNTEVIIEQCYFGQSDNFGSYSSAIGNHGFDEHGTTKYFTNVIIRNNKFYLPDSTFYSIHLYVFANVLIEGNYCEKAQFLNIESKYSTTDSDLYTNSDIVIRNNIADGLTSGSTYSGSCVYVYTFKTDDVSWAESNYASSSTANLIISGNRFSHYGKGVQFNASGVNSAIIDGNILEDCGNNSTSGNSFYLTAQVKSIKIINNILKRCGSLYVVLPSFISGFANKLDIMSDLTITGNSFVDPYISTRTVNITSALRGLIYKNNVVDDSQSTRTTTYQYVNIAATIAGGVMRDNYIYTKSNMGSGKFYNISTNAELIQADNYNYINNVRQ